jgi:hypothetical protein
MRSKLFTLISLTAISIFSIFGGCGGGGGGGDGGSGDAGVQYTGLTTQATIDESNAEQLALGAYGGSDMGTMMVGSSLTQVRDIDRSRILTISEAIEKSILHIDVNAALDGPAYSALVTDRGTIYGNCGGSASYTISVDDITGEFTGTDNYSNYCEDDVTLSGSSSISGIVDLVIGEFIQLRMSYDSLTVTVTGDSITVKGSITYDDLQAPTVHVDMDLLIREISTGKVYWAHNYYLRISKGPGYIDVYIIGRYYDPDCGYVDVETTTDLRTYYGEYWPTRGVLIVEAETGSFGGRTIACLTFYACGACVVDADTDGGGSYNWCSGFLNMYFDEVDPPEAPYNLQPPNTELIVGTNPSLSWTAGARSCGFDVYLDTVNPPLTIVSSRQSETTFQPSGLVASTIYYWKVVAWNAIGSESSDVLSFQTGFDEVDPPEAPYNLQPPNNELIVGTNPSLSWTAGARSYEFDVYLDTVNPPLTIISSRQSETTFQPSGLVASTIYYWKVVAWNAIGSESSDVLSFQTGEVNLSAIIGRGVWSAGNSHEYVVVSFPAQTWDNAVADLNTLIPGYHLATITSQEENDFVANLMTSLSAHGQYWLGGYQDPNELIDYNGWTWLTSEPWDYTNWQAGEPNGGIVENHLAIYSYGGWNDEDSAIGSIVGYIAESYAAVE